jgi:hypothetical protein
MLSVNASTDARGGSAKAMSAVNAFIVYQLGVVRAGSWLCYGA